MALDYDADLNVSLETETEYQSLYKWCLKESKESGDQVGRDLIPFRWNVFLHSTSFGIQRFISSQDTFRFEDENLEALKFDKKDVIVAKLASGHYEGDDWRAPTISMIGSSRAVQEITLKISRIDDVEQETCHVWGSLAYESEIDFRNERVEDTIQISLYLENEKFDSLFDLIRSAEIDRLSLRLSDVQGFYSDWSPAISTDFIKVLANLKDHGLEVDDEWKERIPTLGRVGEVSIAVERTHSAKLATKSVDDDADDWLSESDDDDDDLASSDAKPTHSRGELRQKFYERSLSRISKLLGILIIIELARLFAN
jgi:hypothetical protein